MSFLDTEHRDSRSGAGKFIALALIVLALLGGVAVWFLSTAPEPPLGTEPAERPPAAEREEPERAEEPEPETAPDVPRIGGLEITADVEGASVFLDGERVGEAPFRSDEIGIGRHEVRVEKEGRKPFVGEVRVRPGERAELRASLDLLPPSLRVESDVPGAQVFLDRNYVGTTPVDIKDLTPGEHQLTVSAEGYDMYAETVSVTTGHRDVRVSFQKVDLHETIPVVHKHRMGSCEGTLVADNEGLRYETSNQNDGFRAPYSSLEQFEIDYMDKNLNLKIRGGRNYNFTEKSGDADALFVFHKNVQEFMERL